MSARRLAFTLSLVLASSACGPAEDGSGTGPGSPTPAPTEETTPAPQPTATPVEASRIQELGLWKDGCDSELWGRWRSGDDYTLDAFQVLDETGEMVASVTYFDLEFRGGMEESWRFFDATAFPDSRYRVRFLFGDGSEHEETIDLDPSFFTGPALLEATNVLQDGPAGGLAVYAASEIAGSVQRVLVYDEARCRVHGKVFYSEPQLGSGSTTRLDVGGWFESGSELLVTVEGVDYGANYTYYTTVSVTVP